MYFFLSLIAFILIQPIFEIFGYQSLIELSIILILSFGVFVAKRSSPKRFFIGAGLLGIFFLFWLFTLIFEHQFFLIGERMTIILNFLFTGYCIVSHLIHTKVIIRNTLFAALSLYILLGLIWSIVYGILFSLLTVSFSIHGTIPEQFLWSESIYLSFTTLTTLGYGDIVPLHPSIRMIIILESITGVFFLAIFVSRLVALYTNHQKLVGMYRGR